jgi:predicted MFS family arabinose efflux permease
MYGAMAVGAPLGTAIDARFGFAGVALVAAFAPLPGLLAALLVKRAEPVGGTRLPFYQVASLIWFPGLGLALSALGFGAIAAFATLLFKERSWANAPLAMSAFGGAYVLVRLFFGHLPDRVGGARVAMASASSVAIGQLAMYLATSDTYAIFGAAVTGLGFSLAFPAFGVEAIRRVPPQNRGVALGAYAACFDATLGLGVPLLGVVVGVGGNGAAFAVGSLSAVGSLMVASALAWRDARSS